MIAERHRRALEARHSRWPTACGALIARHKLTNVIAVNGVPSWTLLGFSDAPNGSSKEAVKTLLMIEMLRRGVLTRGLAQYLLRP